MTLFDKSLKRGLDIFGALIGLMLFWPVILITWCVATWDTGASGFFRQTRVGRFGRPFRVVKLRTMRPVGGTTITTANDARITTCGMFFRRWKLDELPQLWNVLKGEMSFVGPRPDVPGYLDKLEGEERRLLQLRPGITGPATLKYHNEEQILAAQAQPEHYNDTIIWPDKVRINLNYLEHWNLWLDIRYIMKTFLR